MNIERGIGSMVVFRAPWRAEDEPEHETPSAANPCPADYCRSRERIERAAAKKATSLIARGIHQDLAQAYARLARRDREH